MPDGCASRIQSRCLFVVAYVPFRDPVRTGYAIVGNIRRLPAASPAIYRQLVHQSVTTHLRRIGGQIGGLPYELVDMFSQPLLESLQVVAARILVGGDDGDLCIRLPGDIVKVLNVANASRSRCVLMTRLLVRKGPKGLRRSGERFPPQARGLA